MSAAVRPSGTGSHGPHAAAGSRVVLRGEITGADRPGIWIAVGGAPYFVAHEKIHWIRDPGVRRVLGLELINGFHLHGDSLDAEFDLDTL